MKIKRVKKAFRTGAVVGGVRGLHEGDLVPDSHPLVKKLPTMFEDVEAYVARRFPELCGVDRPRRGLFGSKEKSKEPASEPEAQPVKPELKRPPASGPGSGVDAWRTYATEATGEPAEAFADLSRDEIIERLDSEGAGNGQE